MIAHDRENNIVSLSGKKNSQSESSTCLEVLSKPSNTDARVQMRHPKGAFQTINSVLNDFPLLLGKLAESSAIEGER